MAQEAQDGPVHKLAFYQNMRILSISAERTYHCLCLIVCIPKWLNQAGAKDELNMNVK
jgi:hypothetical protein